MTNYRPQMRFVKVMFSQVSVCSGGCLSHTPWTDTPGQTPPWQTPLLGQTPPRQIPPAQCMLGYTHPPLPNACWDTANKWAVCIPLEWILVLFLHSIMLIKIFPTAITVKSNKPIISRRHYLLEPSCSFEGDVTTEY